MTWQLPDTYHLVGHGRGTATLKFYEGRGILYVNHDPYNPDQGTGPDGFKQRVGGYRSVLHGFDLRIERQIAEGDWVETHWSLRGTHGGELEGTAPTGKSVYVDGQLLSHIVDGKFVEEWVHWNTLGLLRQIGAVPPPQA